jgi:hypothetical protein
MERRGELKRSADDADGGPLAIIPAVELTGSRQDRLRTLDATIAQRQHLRSTSFGEAPMPPPYEVRGRYINAPVWPWFTAGWALGALFVLLLLLARSYASASALRILYQFLNASYSNRSRDSEMAQGAQYDADSH